MDKGRLTYIDALKGFAMFGVVVLHVANFGVEVGEVTLLLDVVYSFVMPLFMFLSGYVVSAVPDARKCLRRSLQYFSPAIIVGMLFCLYCSLSPLSLFADMSKQGYWYLFVLPVLHWILFFIGRSPLLNRNAMTFFLSGVGVMAMIKVGMVVLPQGVNDLLSFSQWQYWCYFFGGMLVRTRLEQYVDRFVTIKNIALCLVGYAVLFGLSRYGVDLPLQEMLTAWLFIAFIFMLFRKHRGGRVLAGGLPFLGRGTLDIYVFHYFFLPIIASSSCTLWLRQWFVRSESPIVQTLIIMVLTVAISLCCVAIGKALRRIGLVRKILYARY